MRYDRKITLILPDTSVYDPVAGGRTTPIPNEAEFDACIFDMAEELKVQLYGKEFRKGYVACFQGRLQGKYIEAKIDGQSYEITSSESSRRDTVLYLGEKRS